ncbi:MAG: crossover junction endodeoxyribonuclease RuvC [Pseudomonadota bacterium]|jgi:crossover junction endodeoxyribonuclease RuvC
MERILGIDPGLRLTGFGIVERHPAGRIAYVASGVIRVPDGELPARLATIYAQLREVIAEYRPQSAAVEKVFVNVNPQSTLLLGQARGAAICAAATAGLPVAEFTPMQIKQAVVGYGRATKQQVQAMVVRLLALPGTPSKDAADALACAACQAQAASLVETLVAGAAAHAAPTVLARRGARVRRGRLVHS